VCVRLVLAFAFAGNYDVGVWEQVDEALDRDPLSVYSLNRDPGTGVLFLWPYPPLYLVGIALASGLSDVTGLPFHGTVQLWPILADVGIALAVYAYLGRRGAGERSRIAGLALVMLGPSFIAISGYHGQFDQVAVLPAVLALMAWENRRDARAVKSGLLVGVGAAIKTVPGLLAIPLAASARSFREGATLLVAAVAVPVVALAPFGVADPDGVLSLREYAGVPGLGGLSLIADPDRAVAWLQEGIQFHEPTSSGRFVDDNSGPITLLALLGVAALLFGCRPAPIDGAVVVWLALYALSPNFFMQYLVWGLPFFIMAGYIKHVAVLQVVLLPALAITYFGPFDDPYPWADIYITIMAWVWAFWVVALAVVAWRVARRRAKPPEVQAPLVPMRADGDALALGSSASRSG